MTVPVQVLRIVACAAGVGALVWGVRIAVKRRLAASFVTLSFLFAAGAALIACAFSGRLVEAVLHPSQMGRIRMGVAAVGVFALLTTFEAIRHTKLKEKYALLWIFPLLAVLVLTIFTAPMRFIRGHFGMEYASIMTAVVFVSLMSAVFVLAKNLSKVERDISTLTQEVALLNAEIGKFGNLEIKSPEEPNNR